MFPDNIKWYHQVLGLLGVAAIGAAGSVLFLFLFTTYPAIVAIMGAVPIGLAAFYLLDKLADKMGLRT